MSSPIDIISFQHFLHFGNHHNLGINHKLVKNYIFYLMPMLLEFGTKKDNNFSKILPAHCKFFVLLAAKRWRIKANFPLVRADKSFIETLLAAASLTSSESGKDDCDGESVKRNELSMRTIWLKLGLKLGSSTQHDCMINARSGDISSGRLGLSCCILICQQYLYVRMQEKWYCF